MSNQHSEKANLTQQCKAALSEISFPDLATRKLFEGLIQETERTANLLAEQKIL